MIKLLNVCFKGTVSAKGEKFEAEDAVLKLRKAMKGLGTNEKVIIEILSSHCNFELQLIKDQYTTTFGRVGSYKIMYASRQKYTRKKQWRIQKTGVFYGNHSTLQGLHIYMETFESRHDISNNVVCAISKSSDQPAHTRSLIRAIASRLNLL